jgi:hypothetical protein
VYNRANDGVQTGAIAAAGQNSDTFFSHSVQYPSLYTVTSCESLSDGLSDRKSAFVRAEMQHEIHGTNKA